MTAELAAARGTDPTTFPSQEALLSQERKLMSPEGTVPFKSTATVRTLAVVLAKLRHEFRGQLNTIIGCSELLLEDCQPQNCQSLIPDLRKVHLSGQHMLKLVNRLLDPDELETVASDQALKECAAQAGAALRLPLDTVIKFSESLMEDAADPSRPDILNDLRSIRAAAEKMLALLSRLAAIQPRGRLIRSRPANFIPQNFRSVGAERRPENRHDRRAEATV